MEGKRRLLPLLLTATLLAGCKAPVVESPVPTEEPAPDPTKEATLEKETLSEWLSNLLGEEIGQVEWYASTPGPTEEELAALIHAAMEHQVDHAPMTVNGSDTDVIWDIGFFVGSREAGSRFGGDMVTLWAGLEENIVEIFAGENLPDGIVFVEDEALYQLIRTSLDREWVLNDTYYERYKDMVDGFYNELQEETGFSSWELVEFVGYCGTSKVQNEGITVFKMRAAFRTDPPELAPHRLVGGQYVDSQLRVHGLPWYPVHLVTIDGEAIGLTYDDWLDRYPGEDPLSHYTEEEIREMVAHAEEHRGG